MGSDSTIQIQNDDFDNNTLVLVMDNSMKQKIYNKYDRAINVYTLAEYAGATEADVSDPYGKGLEEYNHCFEQLYVLIEKAARNIMGKESMDTEN
jgi:protein-tyrosine-phosphatase